MLPLRLFCYPKPPIKNFLNPLPATTYNFQLFPNLALRYFSDLHCLLYIVAYRHDTYLVKRNAKVFFFIFPYLTTVVPEIFWMRIEVHKWPYVTPSHEWKGDIDNSCETLYEFLCSESKMRNFMFSSKKTKLNS